MTCEFDQEHTDTCDKCGTCFECAESINDSYNKQTGELGSLMVKFAEYEKVLREVGVAMACAQLADKTGLCKKSYDKIAKVLGEEEIDPEKFKRLVDTLIGGKGENEFSEYFGELTEAVASMQGNKEG